MLNAAEGPSRVHWSQIGSLAALNAAVVLSWIAYHHYQSPLLEKFQYSELQLFLIVVQSAVLVFIPPVAGATADYVISKSSNTFVVFTVGISITAMVFMTLAFLAGRSEILELRKGLPLLIVIWLISMNIFHSPANSMIELFAPAQQLPLAMGVIVMITELLYALEPLLADFFDKLGAPVTFAVGATLLILSGSLFRKTTGDAQFLREALAQSEDADHFPAVFAAGFAQGVPTAVIVYVLPQWLMKRFSGSFLSFGNSDYYASVILGIAAVSAFPISMIVEKYGERKGLWTGILMSALSIAWIALSKDFLSSCTALLLLAFSYCALSVSAFPFALSKVSAKRTTLGAGIFFGSVEIAGGLISIYQGL